MIWLILVAMLGCIGMVVVGAAGAYTEYSLAQYEAAALWATVSIVSMVSIWLLYRAHWGKRAYQGVSK